MMFVQTLHSVCGDRGGGVPVMYSSVYKASKVFKLKIQSSREVAGREDNAGFMRHATAIHCTINRTGGYAACHSYSLYILLTC